MWEGPGFVDHHAHLIEVSAGSRYQSAATIALYHRAVAARGETPMDVTDVPEILPDLIARGLEHAASLGIVQITEAGLRNIQHLNALRALRERGPLPVRVRLLIASGLAETSMPDRDDDPWLSTIGVKFYADGWLGPRTCAVRKPFDDGPRDEGILFLDAETLTRRAHPYADQGWTIATHAIGDRAIEAVLESYERIYGRDCAKHGPRIEHAQILASDLIARIAEMGVVCCIQPGFAHSDSDAAFAALGERARETYAWTRLLDGGARLITGSDFPIESLDPMDGLRKLVEGAPVNEGVDAARAFDLMTDPEAGTTTCTGDPRTDTEVRVLSAQPSPR